MSTTRPPSSGRTWLAAAAACVLFGPPGCYQGLNGADAGAADAGSADDAGEGGDAGEQLPEDSSLVPIGGLRRLTVSEYVNTINDLLYEDALPATELLPADPRTPFDNDFVEQVASQGLIDAAEFLAERASEQLLADPARRDQVVGCTPAGPDDDACMRSFVTSFGRRAMRRTLTDAEIEDFVQAALAHAVEADDFYTGVGTVVHAVLQDPEFLYRVEIGTPVDGDPGLFRLSGFERASRLSYFIWGSMPDDALLDAAEAGDLAGSEGMGAAALRMMDNPKAISRIERFHKMWLGFEVVPTGGEIGAAMEEETAALIERVIFEEKRPWQDLFRFNETFISDVLAEHYDLPLPGSATPVWVDYGDSGRAGLLSHGAFLSVGAKFNDTSPVQRGLVIRERLFCQDIGDPPPNVNTDEPVLPENTLCKPERFAAHRQAACAACHNSIDPLGFGLEAYDQFGQFRTHEPDNPETPEDESVCEIDGLGSFEQGDFKGPAELGALAIESGLVNDCVATQLYRFVHGRGELEQRDYELLGVIQDTLGDGEFTFDQLVLEMVSHDSFGFRRQEQ